MGFSLCKIIWIKLYNIFLGVKELKLLKLLGYSLVILYIGLWIGMIYTENTQPKLKDYTEQIEQDLYRIKHNTILSKYIKYGKYCSAVYYRKDSNFDYAVTKKTKISPYYEYGKLICFMLQEFKG